MSSFRNKARNLWGKKVSFTGEVLTEYGPTGTKKIVRKEEEGKIRYGMVVGCGYLQEGEFALESKYGEIIPARLRVSGCVPVLLVQEDVHRLPRTVLMDQVTLCTSRV